MFLLVYSPWFYYKLAIWRHGLLNSLFSLPCNLREIHSILLVTYSLTSHHLRGEKATLGYVWDLTRCFVTSLGDVRNVALSIQISKSSLRRAQYHDKVAIKTLRVTHLQNKKLQVAFTFHLLCKVLTQRQKIPNSNSSSTRKIIFLSNLSIWDSDIKYQLIGCQRQIERDHSVRVKADIFPTLNHYVAHNGLIKSYGAHCIFNTKLI